MLSFINNVACGLQAFICGKHNSFSFGALTEFVKLV